MDLSLYTAIDELKLRSNFTKTLHLSLYKSSCHGAIIYSASNIQHRILCSRESQMKCFYHEEESVVKAII